MKIHNSDTSEDEDCAISEPEVANKTIGQIDCPEWVFARKHRLTGNA